MIHTIGWLLWMLFVIMLFGLFFYHIFCELTGKWNYRPPTGGKE